MESKRNRTRWRSKKLIEKELWKKRKDKKKPELSRIVNEIPPTSSSLPIPPAEERLPTASAMDDCASDSSTLTAPSEDQLDCASDSSTLTAPSEGQEESAMYDVSNSSLLQKRLQLPLARHSPLRPSIVSSWSLSTPSVSDGIAENKRSTEHDFDSHVAEEGVSIKQEYDPGLAGDPLAANENVVTVKIEPDSDDCDSETQSDDSELLLTDSPKRRYGRPRKNAAPLDVEMMCDPESHTCAYPESFIGNSGESSYARNPCVKKYPRSDCMRYHKATNVVIKPYVCTMCPMSYAYKSNLEKHLVKHACKINACPLCPDSFITKVQLRDHQSYYHSREMNSRCKKRKRHLNMPIVYKCKFCSMTFKLKNSLQIHELLHSGKKPFTCYKCIKFFPTESLLLDHKSIHSSST